MGNYWDEHMVDDGGAASYMLTYGEGPGSSLRYKLGSFLKPEEKVLDVGCGPGWNFDHFLEHGPAVYYRGVDYSERFIRVASQRVGMNIFKVGDARKLEEPDASFDVVILQDCLEHTNGYERPVSEALRVAKRRIIITFWRMSEGDTDTINDDGNDGYGAAYSRSKWEKYLDTLAYMWIHDEIHPEGKSHSWHLYVIDKEAKHGN